MFDSTLYQAKNLRLKTDRCVSISTSTVLEYLLRGTGFILSIASGIELDVTISLDLQDSWILEILFQHHPDL